MRTYVTLAEAREPRLTYVGGRGHDGADERRVGRQSQLTTTRRLNVPMAEQLPPTIDANAPAAVFFRGHELAVTAAALSDDERFVYTTSKEGHIAKCADAPAKHHARVRCRRRTPATDWDASAFCDGQRTCRIAAPQGTLSNASGSGSSALRREAPLPAPTATPTTFLRWP